MALHYKDLCVSKHSYHASSFWTAIRKDVDYISHDDDTYTYFHYGKKEYRFRYDPVPGIHKSSWHRKKNSEHLRYKHFINLSITDTHPLSYDEDSFETISFSKSKFKMCYWNVDYMKDYDQNTNDYRKHMSWKNNKSKKKQWM